MRNKGFIERLCIILGILLLVSSIAIFAWWEWNSRSSQAQAEQYTQALSRLLPEAQAAFPEPRRDNNMPRLALGETDFVGILEMPMHGSSLPICADWGALYKLPCLFDGSVYDGSIKIGGTSQKGQFDFYRNISVGDSVFFTDMEGRRYSFTVADLRYEKHADQEALGRRDADLTLFIKNIHGFDYVVVFCDVVK